MRKLLLVVILSCFLSYGCCKTNEKIVSSVEKLQRASELISDHNLKHCKEKYQFYVEKIVSAETEEEKARWQKLADKELEYIKANSRFPEVMQELLDTIKNE